MSENETIDEMNIPQTSEEVQQEEDHDDSFRENKDINSIYNIPIDISVILGCSEIKIQELLGLQEGSVLKLDKDIGELVEIYASKQLIAKGELVSTEKKLAVSITEIPNISGEIKEKK